jgi:hypothetical protein
MPQDWDAVEPPVHQMSHAAARIEDRALTATALARLRVSGVGIPEYGAKLRAAFMGAEAALVLNPLAKGILQPYCRDIRVVTWGMDPKRFPWPLPERTVGQSPRLTHLLFAGPAPEMIKGFHILQDACAMLWSGRERFERELTWDAVIEKGYKPLLCKRGGKADA